METLIWLFSVICDTEDTEQLSSDENRDKDLVKSSQEASEHLFPCCSNVSISTDDERTTPSSSSAKGQYHRLMNASEARHTIVSEWSESSSSGYNEDLYFDLSDQDTGMKYPLDWKCELMYASEECYEGEPADEISSKTTGKN